jgi:hypothetical protein
MSNPQRPETGYYVYGVVTAGTPLPKALRGLDDVPVELVGYDDIAAVVTSIELDRPPGRRAELVAHGTVVDRLVEDVTVVPAQFGSVLADRESVVSDLLEPDHDHFVELLRRLAGLCQLNLRASYLEEQVLAEVVRDRPDIAELRRRTRDLAPGTLHPDLVRLGELVAGEMEAKRAVDTDQVLAVVARGTTGQKVRPGGGVDHLVDVALLLSRDQVAPLEADLEAFAEAVHDRIRLRLTGPTAPYDFVAEAAWA